MKHAGTKNTHWSGPVGWRLAVVGSLLLLISACGVDSGDGDVTNTVALPTDNVLNLYCPDIGLNTETCVLDDPDNPYAKTPFTTGDPDVVDDFNTAKFNLYNAAPSPKAAFYVMATALARAPSGENQWYTALALHELYGVSNSDLIKEQAIRAYRSVLDNFFDSATFFSGDDFLPTPGIAFPVPLGPQTAAILAGKADLADTPLFLPDPADNEFLARETMGSWGYTWVGMVVADPGPPARFIPGPLIKN